MKNFKDYYEEQRKLQMHIKNKNEIELIDPVEMYNSATAMIVEIGEMLQEDTRWKRIVVHSNKIPVYHRENFIKESVDVFLYFLNSIIFAGISAQEFENAVEKVYKDNCRRFGYENK